MNNQFDIIHIQTTAYVICLFFFCLFLLFPFQSIHDGGGVEFASLEHTNRCQNLKKKKHFERAILLCGYVCIWFFLLNGMNFYVMNFGKNTKLFMQNIPFRSCCLAIRRCKAFQAIQPSSNKLVHSSFCRLSLVSISFFINNISLGAVLFSGICKTPLESIFRISLSEWSIQKHQNQNQNHSLFNAKTHTHTHKQ